MSDYAGFETGQIDLAAQRANIAIYEQLKEFHSGINSLVTSRQRSRLVGPCLRSRSQHHKITKSLPLSSPVFPREKNARPLKLASLAPVSQVYSPP